EPIMPDSLAITIIYLSLFGCPIVSTLIARWLSKRGAHPLLCIFGGFIAGMLVLFGPLFNHDIAETLGPGILIFPFLFVVAGAGATAGARWGAPKRP
ncbi:MAG: hypothetical protein ACJ8D2_09075, partial [Sphingomicrobium sp.]